MKNNNTWRIDYETYRKAANAIIKKHESVDEWARLSLSPDTTDEERMIRIMMNNDNHYASNSYICMSYMCDVRPMSEEFLKDTTYVNSGLALIGCWNQKVIDWVINVYSKVIPEDATDATGNALKYVLKAYESCKFEKECPEYHEFLGNVLSEYYRLKEIIKTFTPSEEATHDVDALANEYYELYQHVYRYKNYYIDVHNRLDWAVISVKNLSGDMIEKLVRKGKIAGSLVEDEEQSASNKSSYVTVKRYTGKATKKRVAK